MHLNMWSDVRLLWALFLLSKLTKSALVVANDNSFQPAKSSDAAPSSSKPFCSLNGQLLDISDPDKGCICDKPWIGDDCSILNFEPIDFGTPQGYGMHPNITSWVRTRGD